MKKLLTLLVYGLAAALIAACSPATQQSPDAPAASGSAASGTRMVKDSSGNDVEIPAEVTKVAPTIGAFSAVTAMLGASNKIVAAATSALSPRFKATYPDYEKANPNGYDTKNVEDIIASGAQVVYGPGTLTEEQLAQLKGAGIAFVAIEKLSTVEEMSHRQHPGRRSPEESRGAGQALQGQRRRHRETNRVPGRLGPGAGTPAAR